MKNPYVERVMVGLSRALRFARSWGGEGKGIREMEVEVQRSDRPVAATLFLPDPATLPLPSWVALHGITRPGRRHPALLRFVRALAGSGAAVLVPEIPEWRDLHLALDKAADTVRGAVHTLRQREEALPGGVGVMGFSMGVSPALFSGADPALEGHVKAVVGFGGYCDLDRTLHFLFTGEHDWEGESYVDEPDPYGRWVVGGNYLASVPGFEEAQDVADALLTLVQHVGDLQVGSWEPLHNPLKEKIRKTVQSDHRDLFGGIAPPAGEAPPPELSKVLAPGLARACRRSSEIAEPPSFLDRIRVPTRLVHGRGDRLIPFTESLRMAAAFPRGADVRVYLTGLFAHSKAEGRRKWGGGFRERLHFLRFLSELLGLV